MISAFIISIFTCIYLVCLRCNFELSLILLYVFSMIGPNIHIFNFIIPLNIVLFLIMISYLIIYYKSIIRKTRLTKQGILLILVLIYICINFTVNSLAENNYQFNYVTLFAYFRFVLVYLLITNYKHLKIDKFLFPVIIINVFVILYQLIYPENVSIFYELYGKPSYIVIQKGLEAGYFSRPVGTLLSPVILGVFSLLSFTYYLTSDSKIDNKNIKIFLSACIGIAALSKTAIVGIPIISIVNLIKQGITIKKIKKYFCGVILVIFLVVIYTLIFPEKLETVLWYFKYLYDPFSALATRYSSSGNVNLMFEAIKDYIFFGAGGTFINGIEFNDSMYAVLLIEGGLVFFSLYVIFLLLTLKNLEMFLAIMLAGLAANFSFSFLLLPFLIKENLDRKVE